MVVVNYHEWFQPANCRSHRKNCTFILFCEEKAAVIFFSTNPLNSCPIGALQKIPKTFGFYLLSLYFVNIWRLHATTNAAVSTSEAHRIWEEYVLEVQGKRGCVKMVYLGYAEKTQFDACLSVTPSFYMEIQVFLVCEPARVCGAREKSFVRILGFSKKV